MQNEEQEDVVPDFSENIEGIEITEEEVALEKTSELTPVIAGFSAQNGGLSIQQILSIRAKTPPRFIKTRQGRGGITLAYVPLPIFIRKLNFTFGYGAWSFKVTKSEILEGQALVQGEFTYYNNEGEPRVISQFGGHDIARNKKGEAVDIGDTFKAAASDCFKKCASMLGLFADVYAPSDFIEVSEPKTEEVKKEESEEKEARQQAVNELRTLAKKTMTIADLSKMVREITGKSITMISKEEADSIKDTIIKQAEAAEILKKK